MSARAAAGRLGWLLDVDRKVGNTDLNHDCYTVTPPPSAPPLSKAGVIHQRQTHENELCTFWLRQP